MEAEGTYGVAIQKNFQAAGIPHAQDRAIGRIETIGVARDEKTRQHQVSMGIL